MSARVPDDAATEAGSEALDDAAVYGDVTELTELLQRLQADFDNYRKRTAAQNEIATRQATIKLTKSLLPALDALDALVLAPDLEGAALTQRLFAQALAAAGVSRVEEIEVAFDPTIHEPVNAGVHNVVTAIWRPGYQLDETLLRPATVELS
jgi:molecular chaperone GrpE